MGARRSDRAEWKYQSERATRNRLVDDGEADQAVPVVENRHALADVVPGQFEQLIGAGLGESENHHWPLLVPLYPYGDVLDVLPDIDAFLLERDGLPIGKFGVDDRRVQGLAFARREVDGLGAIDFAGIQNRCLLVRNRRVAQLFLDPGLQWCQLAVRKNPPAGVDA